MRFDPEASPKPHYATGVIVNFTGEEFLISFVQVLPPMFQSESDIPDEIRGTILFRASMTPAKWVEAVESFVGQVHKLREEGASLPPPKTE